MLKFFGTADCAARFLQKEQLSDPSLWAKFVDVFRTHPDSENKGWKGEYWGKMMRGAVTVYEYTRDDELYAILTDSVRDMLSTAEADGRVSSYSRECEFCGWDIWSRKYVMLACEYYLDICRDAELREEIVDFIRGCADYMIDRIGIGADKTRITAASGHWRGLNSSSVLEPIVRLYRLTGEKRYIDFAGYIVNEGGAMGVNIFELAYENKLYPYSYGVSKAYEMISCFEGLLEYYFVTGIEKYKIATVNFARAVLESEVSIIGSCGVTHELFDHTRTRQTVKYDGVIQETCVTVTFMKFCSRILEMTGQSVFADAMEQSFYNAYLGALNTGHHHCAYVINKTKGVVPTYMPFDSYSPLTPGKRGQKVGGYQVLPDMSYYGCCACIGAAGVGVFLKHAVTVDSEGITVNFYERGTACLQYGDVTVTLDIETDYPVDGHIKISVRTDRPTEFTLKLRSPGWADAPSGYIRHTRVWEDDTVEFDLDMPIKLHTPEYWTEDVIYTDMSKRFDGYSTGGPVKVFHDEKDDKYAALTRGPLTLAADSRTGKAADSVFDLTLDAVRCENIIADGVPCLLKLKFIPREGEPFYLVDYSSAGRDWDTVIAAWLPIS